MSTNENSTQDVVTAIANFINGQIPSIIVIQSLPYGGGTYSVAVSNPQMTKESNFRNPSEVGENILKTIGLFSQLNNNPSDTTEQTTSGDVLDG